MKKDIGRIKNKSNGSNQSNFIFLSLAKHFQDYINLFDSEDKQNFINYDH